MTDPIVPISLRLAAFLNEALDLQEDLNTLAEEILPFKQDLNAGISTVELESSIGPAAFLIYHYELNTNDEDGQPGRQLFQSDLRTLERAATLNTPGPRILAHAVTEDEAYILATTPATHRALTGAGPDETPKEIPEEERDNVRKEAAAKAAASAPKYTQFIAEHTVQPGDNLSFISERYYGTQANFRIIYEANRDVIGDNMNIIRPGQVLKIPKL